MPAVDLGMGGKRAAVAASSAGLGLASARALSAEGVRVALCSRDGGRVGAAAASITDTGGDAVGLVADLSTAAGATGFITEASDALDGLDIVVANNGGPPAGTFETTDLDAYGPALEATLVATVAMCQAAVPAMRAQGWGRVVAITSVSVRQPIPTLILSNTARAGLTGFLKTLALEVAGDGVTVNSVQPGSHDTDRIRSVYGDDLSSLEETIPVGTIGRPEDFGTVVAFLCSDAARFVTGAAVPVDGGAYRGLQ